MPALRDADPCDTGDMKRPKRPRDFAQLGKLTVDIATGVIPNDSSKDQEPETRAARSGRKGSPGRQGQGSQAFAPEAPGNCPKGSVSQMGEGW
jgi:hypothetical protein